MLITATAAAQLLEQQDDIVILAHQKPDGDTLGSCFGLLYTLEALGKQARVECADGYPDRYRIIYGSYIPTEFIPKYVVACDVASAPLLGSLGEKYPHVDLCIDHHKSNTLYAENTLLDAASPAATQILYRVALALGVRPDKQIATALYAGLSTDTGCFKFSSVRSSTYRVAAELMDCGADHHAINKEMFDNKTRGRIEVEKAMMNSLSYAYEGRCAIICLPADVHTRYGVTEDELDGISAFPRRIAGVLCGITLREQDDGTVRVSLRCEAPLDGSAICARFGGGGHTAAAGCTITGTTEDARRLLLAAVGEALGERQA